MFVFTACMDTEGTIPRKESVESSRELRVGATLEVVTEAQKQAHSKPCLSFSNAIFAKNSHQQT
jgi:hypothetical protein